MRIETLLAKLWATRQFRDSFPTASECHLLVRSGRERVIHLRRLGNVLFRRGPSPERLRYTDIGLYRAGVNQRPWSSPSMEAALVEYKATKAD